jgi:hypothetical protein
MQLLEYRCDWCGRQKKPQDAWILGLAVEHKGVTGNRRQFETLRRWSAKWASHPLAVHFCCEEHKRKYLDALFASPWPAVDRSALARAAHLRRTGQARKGKDDSGAVAEWRIEDEPSPATKTEQAAEQKKKRRRKPRTANTPEIVFNETDRFHARALGILLDAPDGGSPRPKNLTTDDTDPTDSD